MSELIAFPLPTGPNFTIPDVGDVNWGQAVTDYLVAIPSGVPPTAGTFTLTGDLSFGASFGLVTKYFKSASANIASTGSFRMSHNDSIAFRNFANSGDLLLAVDNSDNITFNGSTFGISGVVNPGVANQLAYYPASTDAVSGLTSIMANRALISNASGLPIASTVTNTTLAFLDATSSVQTQLNSISTVANAALPKSGGAMTGNIAMGSNNITGLANGVSAQDAATVAQVSIANPTGAIMLYGAASAPTGWQLCDGSAINRTTFSALFAVIGTTFGVGDGSTTFNVPSFTNNVPVGAGSIAALGVSAGATTVTPTQASHTHTENSHTHTIAHKHATTLGHSSSTVFMDATDPYGTTSVNHTFFNAGFAGAGPSALNYDLTSDTLTASSGTQSDTGMSSATPAINPASIIQPSLGITFIIKL